jgi:hypothetical protein
VGIALLNEVQQRAARVSGSSVLTAFDAGLVARYIVGITGGVNETGQWKFSPVNRSYASGTSIQTGQDYAALLMGDVSGDWASPAPRLFNAVASDLFAWDAPAVSTPSINARPYARVSVPVRLDSLGGEAVSSYQFSLTYDPAAIEPADLAADLSRTMADGMNIAYHSPSPGVLNVAVYGAFPVTGEGTYVNVNFTVTGKPGSSTLLAIRDFRLNDGIRTVTALNGSIGVISRK